MWQAFIARGRAKVNVSALAASDLTASPAGRQYNN